MFLRYAPSRNAHLLLVNCAFSQFASLEVFDKGVKEFREFGSSCYKNFNVLKLLKFIKFP